MPILHYAAYAFNNRLGINGSHQLHVSWEEIVHAAITVGRSCWRDVLKHGRIFFVRNALSMLFDLR